jgi:hypothetical protein
MRVRTAIGLVVVGALVGSVSSRSPAQGPAIRPVDEKVLREYAGVYRWASNGFVYLQMWNELSGTHQLVAFDESDRRTIHIGT